MHAVTVLVIPTDEEVMIAYDGDQPVYATLISTGQAGLDVLSYGDKAEAEMGRIAPGRMGIVKITLRPAIAFSGPAPDPAALEALHHEAHLRCFIANTLNCEIVIEPPAR